LLVPQVRNKRVQHGSNWSVETSYSFGQWWSFCSQRLDIYEHAASIRDGDDNQVRGTGGESLFPLGGRWNSQYGGYDAYVGQKC
jgi:hypothetical protein